MRKVDQQKSAFQSKKTQKNCFNLQIRNNHNSKKNSFSGEKSVNLAFLVEIRYCFFMYAPAEVSGRVQFLDRAQDIVHQADEQCDRAGVHAEVFREGPEAAVYHVPGDVPRQVTGPVDHRDQGSDGDADQAEFQDEGDCGHEVKDGFDNRARLGHPNGKKGNVA